MEDIISKRERFVKVAEIWQGEAWLPSPLGRSSVVQVRTGERGNKYFPLNVLPFKKEMCLASNIYIFFPHQYFFYVVFLRERKKNRF